MIDKSLKIKINALYSNDLNCIFNAFSGDKCAEWYRWINDDSILAIISPVRSNTVSKLVDTICNIIYEDINLGNNDINFDIEDLYNLETHLQLNGEIAIEWIPTIENGVTKWRYEIFADNDLYEVCEDSIVFKREYEEEDKKYVLLTTHVGNSIVNELFVNENEELKQVPLNSIEDTVDLVEEVIANGVERTAFEFRTKNKIKDTIDWVQLIDEAMTFLNLGVRESGNALYIPVDIGTTVGLNNPGTVVNQMIKDRMKGVIKLPGDKDSRIESIQGEVLTEQYKQVRDIAISEVLSNMGISPASYDYTDIGANASGESISQRKDLTRRTRNWLINERSKQLQDMYEALGFTYDVSFSTFKDMLPLDEQLKVMALVNGNMIPHEVGLLMIDSSLTEEEAREMAAKVNDNVSGLSLMTGVSGT